VLAARPEVLHHNTRDVRACIVRSWRAPPKGANDKALCLLRPGEGARRPTTCSLNRGIIVGLGETNDDVGATLRDLRAHRVYVVTMGQYLPPSTKHAENDRWILCTRTSSRFREQGEALCFGSVSPDRSCARANRADEQRHAAETGPRVIRVLVPLCEGPPEAALRRSLRPVRATRGGRLKVLKTNLIAMAGPDGKAAARLLDGGHRPPRSTTR